MKPAQLKKVLEMLYRGTDIKGRTSMIYVMSMFLRELGEKEFMTLGFQWARAIDALEAKNAKETKGVRL